MMEFKFIMFINTITKTYGRVRAKLMWSRFCWIVLTSQPPKAAGCKIKMKPGSLSRAYAEERILKSCSTAEF